MPRLLISAAHKSSGKTTVSVGLCAALNARGVKVQAFKKGPDYIDPMWLKEASGRPCFNLDPYLMSSEQIQSCFRKYSAQAEISVVEGNKGLYDGLALDGSNSNAALAHLLDLPVILVIDARGMTRGIAPLILGYQAFDRRIRIAGVILNQLGGSRHESKLRAVIEHYTDAEVVGAIAHDPQLSVVERHLGLMPNNELDDAADRVRSMGARIAAQVDIDRVLQIASGVKVQEAAVDETVLMSPQPKVRIGVAMDKAFGFYYPDDMLALECSGAEVVPFDTLKDSNLPEVDGIFIGGGFPEMFLEDLQANASMRSAIRSAIEADMPVYAECGGLMYLTRSISWKGQTCQMVGALGGEVLMHERPVGRGYVELALTKDAPWSASPTDDGKVRGHEFHYSSLENAEPGLKFAYDVNRGHGVEGKHDGIIHRNVLASYSHLRCGAGSQWVKGFVAFVRAKKKIAETEMNVAHQVLVNGSPVATDSEGYLRNLEDWSEDFARARARMEELALTDEHWAIIRFLRAYYEEHRVQAQVRTMIRHFTELWGAEKGSNHHLHDLFPIGGPQKQGNRLAGLLRTKGEH